MAGGKGGSTTSEIKIPKFLEDAAKANLARANETAEIGYVPYYGPDVAAMTPMQEAAIRNINEGASAFGLSAPPDPMAGVPQAQEFAGGVRGYSSAPIFEQSLDQLQQNRPGQFDAIMRMFIDPATGVARQPDSFGGGAGQSRSSGMGGGK